MTETADRTTSPAAQEPGGDRQWWRRNGPIVAIAVILLLTVGLVAWLVWQVGQPRLAQREDRNEVREAATAVLWFCFVSGLAGMAIIQTAKHLFGLRGRYQQRQVSRWLVGREGGAALPATDATSDPRLTFEKGRAWGELQEAMGVRQGGRDVLELFDLPIEQLAAQISAASDVALRDPSRHRALLVALVSRERAADITTLEDKDQDAAHEPTNQQLDELDKIRGIVAQQLQAGIDTLQVSVGQRWRRYVRTAALLMSTAFAAVAVQQTTIARGATGAFILAALLLGGFFSWLLRDAVAVVERLRSR
jgi:hypothetical protein